MLELKNITINLSKTGKVIIENFSFALNDGDKAVIIGEEGNGKSTLLKLIYDAELIDGYCEYSGSIVKKGKLAYLPQMLDASYSDYTVARYFDIDNDGIHSDIFTSLGLSPNFAESEQCVGTLSGGEKVKMQLARLLIGEPDILLLDEPTNDIDIETLEWLEGFIKHSSLPILYVSHDETLIENTANVIIHIEQLIRKTISKVTVVRMGYREYVSSRRLLFDKQMQVAQKQRSDYADQMERWTQIYNRVDHEQSTISRGDPSGGRLLKKKMKSVKAMERRLERQAEDFLDIPETEEAIITKFDADISIPNSKVTLDFSLPRLEIAGRKLSENIKLHVTGSAHIGIVGRNGAGKSTLLKQIWLNVRDRRDIVASYMPQDYSERLDYAMTPVDFLAASYTKDEVTRARTYMGSMKFTHEEMTGRIGELSGGQRAKLLFLDMVLRRANLLLLDEPTRNFSPLSNPVVRAALIAFGGAIISVSHDRKYLSEVCERVYTLDDAGLHEMR